MKRSIKDLIECNAETIQGDVLEIVDFYFDEERLRIRYMLVETGNWPFRRNAIIPVEAIERFDWDQNMFLVNLLQEQILTSPEIDGTKPISRKQEQQLLNYYFGRDSWNAGNGTTFPGGNRMNGYKADITVRSIRELIGYYTSAIDGEVGVVDDYVVDDETWKLHSMVLSVERWIKDKKVIISPRSITGFDREHGKVFVNLSEIAIKNSLPYETARVVMKASHENQQV